MNPARANIDHQPTARNVRDHRHHVQPVGGNFDFIHLHDGTGLFFGTELPPIATTGQPGNIEGTWSVVTGQVYVFEVHVPGGGFF